MNKAYELQTEEAGKTTVKATVRQADGQEVTRLPRVPLPDDQYAVFEIAENEEIISLSNGDDVDTLVEVPFVGGDVLEEE